jgi:hypothetical protein
VPYTSAEELPAVQGVSDAAEQFFVHDGRLWTFGRWSCWPDRQSGWCVRMYGNLSPGDAYLFVYPG